MAITGITKYDSSVKNNETKIISLNIEFFAVRNQDGQFFHGVGYGGSGKTWVDDIRKAKIYPKIGQARARVTWFKTHYPEYATADIIKIIADKAEILNESERVDKTIKKKEEKELKWKKERLERDLKDTQAEYEKIGNKLKDLNNEIF